MLAITARRLLSPLLALLVLAGCQPGLVGHPPGLSIDRTPAALAQPASLDWLTQRINSPAIARARKASLGRHTLAYPSASTGWATPGIVLTTYGAAASDAVTSGPAAAFRTASTDPLFNKLFFLTKAGLFVRVDRTAPTSTTGATAYKTLNLGATCSHTYVSLSPSSTRAYLLADNGTLSIVNTLTMSLITTLGVGGGYGIAPVVDPYASLSDDTRDEIYVAGNDGNVTHWTITPSKTAPYVSISASTVYPVATSVTPLYAGTRKIAAPPVVLGGLILAGDQAGNLQAYDTSNTANNYSYSLGQPIDTAPAVEVQDGSYSLTDPLGNPVVVANNKPIYAFVTAGGSCSWINLSDTSVTRSLALRIDDNSPATKFGYLLNYGYSVSGTTEYLAAADGVNINTEAPDFAMPTSTGGTALTTNDVIMPADTNTHLDATNTNAAGGPILGYMRWASAKAYAAGSIVTSATLSLTAQISSFCRVSDIRSTLPTYASSSTPWSSSAFTNANRPAIGSQNIGAFLSGGVNASGNYSFKANKQAIWDVTPALSTGPQASYAFAAAYSNATGYDAGDAVLWPYGPVGAASGKKARKAYQVSAMPFTNNALNANPAAATAGDSRPLLTLLVSSTVLPTPTIETPPVIDSLNKRVYVFYTNTLYAISFASPTQWADAEYASTGKQYTIFDLAYWGDTANGGGATYNAAKTYVGNDCAPDVAYDLSALYAISRYPNNQTSPTTWNYALSKFNLTTPGTGLSPTAENLVAGSPTFSTINPGASPYLVLDPFSGAGAGGNVYFGLGNGLIYQYDH